MVFKKRGDVEDSEIDIEDVEGYRGEPDKKYSHELLVMEQYRRTIKTASEEMKKGYEERKYDRTGNIISIKPYPDTRKQFAESVKTLKNIMIGNINDNEDFKERLTALFEKIKVLEKHYVDLEEKEWQLVPPNFRHPVSNWTNRWEHITGTLNYDHFFGEKYLQTSVDYYRDILEEITLLLHRMGYFTGEHSLIQ